MGSVERLANGRPIVQNTFRLMRGYPTVRDYGLKYANTLQLPDCFFRCVQTVFDAMGERRLRFEPNRETQLARLRWDTGMLLRKLLAAGDEQSLAEFLGQVFVEYEARRRQIEEE